MLPPTLSPADRLNCLICNVLLSCLLVSFLLRALFNMRMEKISIPMKRRRALAPSPYPLGRPTRSAPHGALTLLPAAPPESNSPSQSCSDHWNSHPVPPVPAQNSGQHGLRHGPEPRGGERAGRMLGEAARVWSATLDQRTIPGPTEPQPGPRSERRQG